MRCHLGLDRSAQLNGPHSTCGLAPWRRRLVAGGERTIDYPLADAVAAAALVVGLQLLLVHVVTQEDDHHGGSRSTRHVLQQLALSCG
jgi:hypothetical protein